MSIDMKRNYYGFKICYREFGSPQYIRHFITYTYEQAKQALDYYLRYPPRARNDNHKLNNPTWKIIPINKDEIRAGIWREVPF